MKAGTIAALVVTGLVILICASATGTGGLMMWALALNGFMGQETAVNASLATYISTALLSGLVAVVLGLLTVRYLAVRKEWNAAGAAALSSVVFSVLAGVIHVLCVIVSAIVASVLRT